MIGKWVFLNNDQGYNSGVVVKEIGEYFLLVAIRAVQGCGPARLGLFDLQSLTEDESGSAFFSTEQELDNFLLWLETPEEAGGKLKVVPITKGGK